jgi:hypothetical protein
MLEFRTSPDRAAVKEFSSEFQKSLSDRKRHLELMKNPDVIQENKMTEKSKVIQLAFLDKIIEDCEIETGKNIAKETNKELNNFYDAQNDRINFIDLKIHFSHEEGGGDKQVSFERSFYGKQNVEFAKKEQEYIRKKIHDNSGSK